jgi:hypothetical protein
MFFSSDIYSIDSSAVIGLSQLIYGKIPQSQSAFDTLKSAVSLQESSLIGRSVADSDLFGYETLGKTLGETAEGRAKFGGGTDAEFVQRIYKEIFGRDPGQDQVDHFVGQITSFKALYTAAGLSETTIDFGSRGAIAGQIMGSGILDGATPYATGVLNVINAGQKSGFEFGKSMESYAQPATGGGGGGGGGGITPPPADVITKVTDGSLVASSTKGDGSIQAGTGIPNEGFQITTNVTKGIELGLMVVKRGGPDIYTVSSTDSDGIVHIEAPAGHQDGVVGRAAVGVAFSVNTGINDALTGPFSTKFYADTDGSAAINFEVFDIYKDTKVTSANLAQDVFNLAFLSTPQPDPAAGSSYAYKIETTDLSGHVVASQTIIVDLVGAPVPDPVI